MNAEEIQLGAIGAMQRAHPALTETWLRWTGIPDLEFAEFNYTRSEEGISSTQVMIAPRPRLSETIRHLCDGLGLDEKSPERERHPIFLANNHPGHNAFWQFVFKRDRNEVDGPLEFWWRFLVLRRRSLHQASKLLTHALFGDEPFFDRAVVSFKGSSLGPVGRRSADILIGPYQGPTSMVVTHPVIRKAKIEGLAFDLSHGTFKSHLTATLQDLAIRRSV